MIVLDFVGNVDYRIFSTRRTVTFAARRTRAQYLGSLVVNDGLVEPDETFDLIIDDSSLPTDVSLGDPCQTRMIILDDDGE